MILANNEWKTSSCLEALVIALLKKGATYREITKELGVSPNTVKAIASKAGLGQTTSESSRAFELFLEGKSHLEVAIKLNREANEVIRFHQEYFMLLRCTEFTKAYPQIKDNPWPFVNLANLVQNAKMGDGEVVELLKIANGHLPRVRLEYDIVNEELNSTKTELNSWKAELRNTVRIYQDFCDRNLKLKNREGELKISINELETKEAELQKKKTTYLNQHLSELQQNSAYNDNHYLEIKEEEVIFMNDVFISPSNVAINCHQNENEILSQSSTSPVLPLNESPFETLHVPRIQDELSSLGGGNHKIIDTGELSHVNPVFDNTTTFEVNSESKEKGSESMIWQRKTTQQCEHYETN
jgi:predicted transcriptional regulator